MLLYADWGHRADHIDHDRILVATARIPLCIQFERAIVRSFVDLAPKTWVPIGFSNIMVIPSLLSAVIPSLLSAVILSLLSG